MGVLNKASKVISNYFDKIWTGGKQLFETGKQYLYGLLQEQEIFSKKWIADSCDTVTLNQSDYFLKEGKWNELKMNINRIKYINSTRQTRTKANGVLIIDDTGIERYKRDEERGIYYQYSGELKGTGYCKVVVTAHYKDDKRDFPIEMESYYMGEESKIELAKSLIEKAINMGVKFSHVIFDSWYLSKELTDYIKSINKSWISSPKMNRNVILNSGKKMKVSSLVTATSSDSSCLLQGYLSDLGKVGFTQMKDERIIVTNDFNNSADIIRDYYDDRVVIEQFYREVKQQMNFRSFHVHDAVQISRHWYLVFAAYTFCKIAKLKGWLSKITNKIISSISDVVQVMRQLNTAKITQMNTNVYLASCRLKVIN